MKAFKKSLLLSCIFFISLNSSFGQSNKQKDNFTHKQSVPEVNLPNIVKLNAPALFINNFSIQYERALTKKISGTIGLRLMPKSKLPMRSLLENIIDEDEAWEHIDKVKIGNFAITPEVRFYMGKKAMSGFYIAPFARIAKYTVDMPFDFKEEIYDPQDGTYLTTVEGEIPLHGKINSFTGGLLFGAQWKIAKQVFLDWWILGPHYGSANGSVIGKKTLSKIRKFMTPSGQGTTRYSSILF